MNERPRVLVVCGSTATGKSSLGMELACALGGEIVGCEAIQVYRGFDAGTAKPSAVDRRRIPHHLIDHVDPDRDYSLAEYVPEAEAAIEAVQGRGAIPILVGGTGLYLRGLLRGIISAPSRNPEFRARLRSIAERGGGVRLHRLLTRRDPTAARRIPPADVQRLIRALELAADGTSWSQRLARRGTWSAAAVDRYPSLKIGLAADPQWLSGRIDRRVDRFFEKGLVDEIRSLLSQGVPRTANAFKAIGYREVLEAVELGRDPISSAEEIRRSTRRYSKRQRTWFKKEPGVNWMDAAEDRELLVQRVLRLWGGQDPAKPT